MVNNVFVQDRLHRVSQLVAAYVVVVVATIVVLALLSATGSPHATSDAWVHAVVVAAFAVLLPLRLRAARAGSARALVAVALIATVVAVVNVVEALMPGAFPGWMRVEMVAIAVLMAVVAALAAPVALSARARR